MTFNGHGFRAACIAAALSSTPMMHTASASESGREALAVVKGVTAPFSLYGLTESLRQIPGVDRVAFDMERGIADITFKPGASATEAQIRQAIGNASFTPGKMTWKPAPGGGQ